jgi:predicted nucleic acid-binding protein
MTSTSAGYATMDEISATSRVYIDSNIFIYLIEAVPDFFAEVEAIFALLHTVGARVMTNEITVSECIYKPHKTDDFALVKIYEELFADDGDIQLQPLSGELANRAAAIAENLGLKLIDAIHYLSALEANCDYFITSDMAFRSGRKMTVIHIRK